MGSEVSIPSTVPMHSFAHVTLTNGIESVIIKAEFGTPIIEIIQTLTGRSDHVGVSLIPIKQQFVKIPLQEHYQIADPEVRLFVTVGFRFNISPQMFTTRSVQSEAVVILSSSGVIAFDRRSCEHIRDISSTASILELTSNEGHVSDSIGYLFSPDAPVPRVAVLTQKILTDGDIDLFNDVDVSCSLEGILFQASEERIRDIHSFLQFTGMSEMVMTFGWIFVHPIQFDPEANLSRILLIPKPGRFRLSTDDMRQMMTLHFFLFQLKRFDFGQDHCKALCRFKMFGMWIWRGEIPVQSTLHPIVTFWNKAQQIMKKQSDIRLLCQGQIIAPGIPLRTYCDASESVMPVMDICIEASMIGGGPIDLKPAATRQVQLSPQTAEEAQPRVDDDGPLSVQTHDLSEADASG